MDALAYGRTNKSVHEMHESRREGEVTLLRSSFATQASEGRSKATEGKAGV